MVVNRVSADLGFLCVGEREIIHGTLSQISTLRAYMIQINILFLIPHFKVQKTREIKFVPWIFSRDLLATKQDDGR